MNLSLHLKLEVIKYVKRTGVNKSSSTRLWHGLHDHLTRIEGAPLTYDHKQLQLFFHNSLLPDILRNRLPIPPEDVQQLCYPFLLRLYNFHVIVTERGTSAALTQEKLKLHKLFVRYLLSDKVFDQEIWNEIRTIGPSLHAKTFYVDLNNPQIQLERVEKNKLRRRRAPQDRTVAKKRPSLTDGWLCSKKANLSNGKQPKPCDQADSSRINLQPLQDAEKCCKDDLPVCISSEPQVLIRSIEQAKTTSPTMLIHNLSQLVPQELSSTNSKTLDHPNANESNGSEDQTELGDHPNSSRISSQAPQDGEKCSSNIESIVQSKVNPFISSQHLSDQSEKRLDFPEPQELTTTPKANDSNRLEDQRELDDHSTITSQPLEDAESSSKNDSPVCASPELKEITSINIETIDQSEVNYPSVCSQHLSDQSEYRLDFPEPREQTSKANDSNGSEDQPELGDHPNSSTITSQAPQNAEKCSSNIESIDQSKVNPLIYSQHLSDQSEKRLDFPEPQELTTTPKANDSNRLEDQRELDDHSTITYQPLEDAESSSKNDSPICASPELQEITSINIETIDQSEVNYPSVCSQHLSDQSEYRLDFREPRELTSKANDSNGSEDQPKLGDHPNSSTITSQAPQNAEKCSSNIESIDQSKVNPLIYSQHLSDQSEKRLDFPEPQELTTTPKANDSNRLEDQRELDDHSTITTQPLEDTENDCENDLTICMSAEPQEHASTIIGTIEQEKPNSPIIFSHNLSQLVPQELTRTSNKTNHPEANDSNESEDLPHVSDHPYSSTITSQAPQDAENCGINIESIDQSKVNPLISNQHLSDQSEKRLDFPEPQELTTTPKANDSNGFEDQRKLDDHSTITSQPVQDTENCCKNNSPIRVTPDSPEIIVNNTTDSVDLFDDCSSDDLTIANINRSKDLPYCKSDALELTSAKNEANDSPTVGSQKLSNRSEEQSKPLDHSYSISTSSRLLQTAVNCCKNDSTICINPEPREGISSELHEPIDFIDISEDSCSDDCIMKPENARTVNDLVCIKPEPNELISTKNKPIARSRRILAAVKCKTDSQGRRSSGTRVLIGTNDNTIASIDISDDSCSEDFTMQHVNGVNDLTMVCTNSKPKKRVTINNNTIDLTEISDDSNCSIDLPIPYSMYDLCSDDNDE